jgi:hypothetical protein
MKELPARFVHRMRQFLHRQAQGADGKRDSTRGSDSDPKVQNSGSLTGREYFADESRGVHSDQGQLHRGGPLQHGTEQVDEPQNLPTRRVPNEMTQPLRTRSGSVLQHDKPSVWVRGPVLRALQSHSTPSTRSHQCHHTSDSSQTEDNYSLSDDASQCCEKRKGQEGGLDSSSPSLTGLGDDKCADVDYTIHHRNPVVQEDIYPQVHTVYHPVKTRSIHLHHHIIHVQPIIDTSGRMATAQED